MDPSEQLRGALAVRRATLGDAYVDAVAADDDPASVEFQDYVTCLLYTSDAADE